MPLTVGQRIDRAHKHPGGTVTARLHGLEVPVAKVGNAARVMVEFTEPGDYTLEWLRNGKPWRVDTLRVLPGDANQRNVRLG